MVQDAALCAVRAAFLAAVRSAGAVADRGTAAQAVAAARAHARIHCGLARFGRGPSRVLAGGVAAALNYYLDLFAGVMILWYGGSIAMDPKGAISVGQLITYQLYWNMINTSIQALNDMVHAARLELSPGSAPATNAGLT